MSKFVNGVMVALVVFVLAVTFSWYVLEIRREADVAFDQVTLQWGTVDARTSEILVGATIGNGHPYEVHLRSIENEIVLNGERIDWDASTTGLVIPAGESRTVELVARIPAAFVGSWWSSHMAEGERSTMLVRGNVSIDTGREQIQRDYTRSVESATNLEASVEDAAKNCGSSALSLCLDRTDLTLPMGSMGGTSTIDATNVFRNTNDASARLENLSFTVSLHGVEVGRGNSSLVVHVPAQEQVEVGLRGTVSETAIAAWWPLHTASCEESRIVYRVSFDLIETSSLAEPTEADPVGPTDAAALGDVLTHVSWDFDAGTFSTALVCRA